MSKPKSKIKKPYIASVLAVFLLCFMAKNGYATAYNLQPYTSCVGNYCTTSLDVSTLGLSQNKINALKTVNITNFLIKSGIINNFAYSWVNNTLTITGKVSDSVYWKFNAGSDSYDPWWNATGCYNTTNSTLNFTVPGTTGAGTTAAFGYVYNASVNQKIIEIRTEASCNANHYIINSSSNALLEQGSISSNKAATSTVVAANDKVYIYADSSGSGYNRRYTFPVSDYPKVGLYGFAPTGASTEGAFPYVMDNSANNLVSITIVNEIACPSVYYTTNLYLNGNETNITIPNSTALNVTALTNLTGLNVSLFMNGTLIASGINSSSNVSNWSSSIYNITAFFWNASTNSSLTRWATLTFTSPTTANNITIAWNVNMNDAPGVCLADNKTFQRQTNLSYGSTYQTLTENYTCPYGCSANNCNYPTWINSIITLVIVGAALFLIYKVV